MDLSILKKHPYSLLVWPSKIAVHIAFMNCIAGCVNVVQARKRATQIQHGNYSTYTLMSMYWTASICAYVVPAAIYDRKTCTWQVQTTVSYKQQEEVTVMHACR